MIRDGRGKAFGLFTTVLHSETTVWSTGKSNTLQHPSLILMLRHRLQENPVYDPTRKEAHVKPGSTILVQVQTNNHVHEWKLRQPGRHLIFLAGKSGTQLTTANQLTWDRLVFSAPSCKYAHIVGEPPDELGGFGGDPGFTWLPLKLVDATGAWLPEGTYQFRKSLKPLRAISLTNMYSFRLLLVDRQTRIQRYAIITSFSTHISLTTLSPDFMIPDYSHAFDIVISNDATSSGAVPSCNDTETACHESLVGTNACPGAKDTASPWPPYVNDGAYLFTNPDGDDPSTPNGKRTFQPYWTEYIESSPAPEISYAEPRDIKKFTDEELLTPIPIAGGDKTFPEDVNDYPWIPAGKVPIGPGSTLDYDFSKELPVTQKYVPLSVAGGSGGAAADPVAASPSSVVSKHRTRVRTRASHGTAVV